MDTTAPLKSFNLALDGWMDGWTEEWMDGWGWCIIFLANINLLLMNFQIKLCTVKVNSCYSCYSFQKSVINALTHTVVSSWGHYEVNITLHFSLIHRIICLLFSLF